MSLTALRSLENARENGRKVNADKARKSWSARKAEMEQKVRRIY